MERANDKLYVDDAPTILKRKTPKKILELRRDRERDSQKEEETERKKERKK